MLFLLLWRSLRRLVAPPPSTPPAPTRTLTYRLRSGAPLTARVRTGAPLATRVRAGAPLTARLRVRA
jgi:hypothetical protein